MPGAGLGGLDERFRFRHEATSRRAVLSQRGASADLGGLRSDRRCDLK
jgi:hypothetical protein